MAGGGRHDPFAFSRGGGYLVGLSSGYNKRYRASPFASRTGTGPFPVGGGGAGAPADILRRRGNPRPRSTAGLPAPQTADNPPPGFRAAASLSMQASAGGPVSWLHPITPPRFSQAPLPPRRAQGKCGIEKTGKGWYTCQVIIFPAVNGKNTGKTHKLYRLFTNAGGISDKIKARARHRTPESCCAAGSPMPGRKGW